MCLACQMEGEWLAYLEQMAQRELPPDPEAAAAGPSQPAKPAPASRFICEEQPPE